LFEHLVVNQILASAKAHDIAVKLSYFRTRGGFEVDLILQIGRIVHAIEIKSRRADHGDAAKLEEFLQYVPKSTQLFVVTPDDAPRKIGRVTITGLNEFLSAVGL
jgi:predicted AAA+ superfamily ATPase